MSNNITNQVQRESTVKPVSGKVEKGSGCENQVAAIEKESCTEKKISFSDMVAECVNQAFYNTPKNNIYDSIKEWENKLISQFETELKKKLKDLLCGLRKERNEKVEFLRLTNQPIKYDYRRLPSYKFVKAFRVRLTKGKEETDGFDFGYKSTESGIVKTYKCIVDLSTNKSVLQYRFTNSLLMLKQHEREQEREQKMAELKSICEEWLNLNISKEQAESMNRVMNNAKLSAYIEYLDLLAGSSQTDSDMDDEVMDEPIDAANESDE